MKRPLSSRSLIYSVSYIPSSRSERFPTPQRDEEKVFSKEPTSRSQRSDTDETQRGQIIPIDVCVVPLSTALERQKLIDQFVIIFTLPSTVFFSSFLFL